MLAYDASCKWVLGPPLAGGPFSYVRLVLGIFKMGNLLLLDHPIYVASPP